MSMNSDLFREVVRLVEAHCGNSLEQSNRGLIRVALAKHARERGSTQSQYLTHLLTHPKDLATFCQSLLVVESWLWREVEPLREALLELREKRSSLTILSAPCARGEEAFTAAALANDVGYAWHQITIHGCDLSQTAIRTAQAGMIVPSAIRGETPPALALALERSATCCRIIDAVQQRCHFEEANLLDPNWTPPFSSYDIVLCRNLLIYLNSERQGTLLRKLKALVAPGGMLILSSAEMPLLDGPSLLPVSSAVNGSSARSARLRLPTPKATTVTQSKRGDARRPPAMPIAKEPTVLLDIDLNKPEEACEILIGHIEREPNSAEAHFLLGTALSILGRCEVAAVALERALALDPTHEDAALLLELNRRTTQEVG